MGRCKSLNSSKWSLRCRPILFFCILNPLRVQGRGSEGGSCSGWWLDGRNILCLLTWQPTFFVHHHTHAWFSPLKCRTRSFFLKVWLLNHPFQMTKVCCDKTDSGVPQADQTILILEPKTKESLNLFLIVGHMTVGPKRESSQLHPLHSTHFTVSSLKGSGLQRQSLIKIPPAI